MVSNGMPTTMQLTERDALRLGAVPVDAPPVVVVVTAAVPDEEPDLSTKAHTAANKRRRVRGKDSG